MFFRSTMADLDPGKGLQVKSSFKPANSGELEVYPGVCVLTGKGEICHEYDTSCTLDVFIECPENWSCMTAEQASGNYVRLSDEVCGYQISGLAALTKTPMYCYREVVECPEGTECLTPEEAEKNGMEPTGLFCSYEKGQEKYCYSRGKPDLAISDVWWYNTTPEVYSELRALIYNRGDGYAGSFTVAFFIDGDYVGEVEVNGLGVNENTVARLSYPHPCEVITDTVSAEADYYKEVAESDENNNYYKNPRPFQCSGRGMPNLKVSDAYIDYADYCRALTTRTAALWLLSRMQGIKHLRQLTDGYTSMAIQPDHLAFPLYNPEKLQQWR